ncbi:hypothetical protein D9M70_619360 [compost metagenome]
MAIAARPLAGIEEASTGRPEPRDMISARCSASSLDSRSLASASLASAVFFCSASVSLRSAMSSRRFSVWLLRIEYASSSVP